MADDSYCQSIAVFRSRQNYPEVFRNTLEDLAGKVDLSHVKSCVAFGTSSGEREMEFARRLLPNLRSFTAVEQDPESIEALRTSFQEGKLPGVETSVVESSVESWSGVDSHIDAAVFFNVLGLVPPDNRKALYHQLMTQYLSPEGIVVICHHSNIPYIRKRLGVSAVVYDKLEEEMTAAGFRVVSRQDFEFHFDLTDPNEVARHIGLRYGKNESEVREAIDDLLAQPEMPVYSNKLAIFTK